MNENRLKKLLEMEAENPSDPFLKYALAQEYTSGGQLAEAERYYSLLVHHHPEYLATYYQYASLAGQNGNFELAEHLLNTGIELARKQNDFKTVRELNQLMDNLQFERES